jgi:hypothetical protein
MAAQLKVPDNVLDIVLWALGIAAVIVVFFTLLWKVLAGAFRRGKKIMRTLHDLPGRLFSSASREGNTKSASEFPVKPDLTTETEYMKQKLSLANKGEKEEKEYSEWLREQVIEINQKLQSMEATLATIKEALSEIAEPKAGNDPKKFPEVFGAKLQRDIPNFPEAQSGRFTGTAVTRAVVITSIRHAREVYMSLVKDGLRACTVQPSFAVLDIDSSGRERGFGKKKYYFQMSESKQSAFVIFQSANPKEGYLFPNPTIAFTEAMNYIFNNLSYDKFEIDKSRIDPRIVSLTAQGTWEMICD